MRLTRFTRFAIARFAPTATPRAEDNRVCGVSLYTDGGNTICEASRAYGSATVSHSCPFLFLVSVAVRSMENALLPPPSPNGPSCHGGRDKRWGIVVVRMHVPQTTSRLTRGSRRRQDDDDDELLLLLLLPTIARVEETTTFSRGRLRRRRRFLHSRCCLWQDIPTVI